MADRDSGLDSGLNSGLDSETDRGTDSGISAPVARDHEALGLSVACSRDPRPGVAAQELKQGLDHPDLGFVLFFVSAEYPLDELAEAIDARFGELPVAGCTSAGEITPTGYARGSIVAIGFDRRHYGVATTLIEELDDVTLPDAQRRVEALLSSARRRLPGEAFALTLLDGLSASEEQVLATLDAALGGIPSFGGSAGDDNHLAHTHVFTAGRFHSGAAVVVLITTHHPFEVFSSHHLKARREKLVVTRADAEGRRVLELNALPAVDEYARWVGVPASQLDEGVFARFPLAVKLGDAYYVRSIQRANADGSLSFYCAVETGIVLTAMAAEPILTALEHTLSGLRQRLGSPQLIIGCDCFLRRLEIEALDQVAEASRHLSGASVLGFNTYGEQHHGMHVNQTFTGVAIGSGR
ncbi:FIST C-terminal domain-containing protein [Halomonas denitrificans]|uniref:nitric oxide-sensing protein NosP n=1 Tax=Halomonas denitrificans TaxID=370769 RepID=UPI001CD76A37|nr:nitric oxide-sensing protein NosP [Halomonas denitrificans]MCA0974642.1 FIST C-terminal domain-containing protein [Halomonas denitrificans]